MRRLFQTLICAAGLVAVGAWSDSAAMVQRMGVPVAALSAPTPTASCTVALLSDGQYETTVTWSGFSAVSLELSSGGSPIVQSVFAHPIHNGTMTFTTVSAPTLAQVNGTKIGVRTPCN